MIQMQTVEKQTELATRAAEVCPDQLQGQRSRETKFPLEVSPEEAGVPLVCRNQERRWGSTQEVKCLEVLQAQPAIAPLENAGLHIH